MSVTPKCPALPTAISGDQCLSLLHQPFRMVVSCPHGGMWPAAAERQSPPGSHLVFPSWLGLPHLTDERVFLSLNGKSLTRDAIGPYLTPSLRLPCQRACPKPSSRGSSWGLLCSGSSPTLPEGSQPTSPLTPLLGPAQVGCAPRGDSPAQGAWRPERGPCSLGELRLLTASPFSGFRDAICLSLHRSFPNIPRAPTAISPNEPRGHTRDS